MLSSETGDAHFHFALDNDNLVMTAHSGTLEDEVKAGIHYHVHGDHFHRHQIHPLHSPWAAFVYLLFVVLCQVAVFYWRNRAFASFRKFTLVGIWIVPSILCALDRVYSFLILWTVFTLTTLYIRQIAFAAQLDPKTPRRVFSWFNFVSKSGNIGVALAAFLLFDALSLGLFASSREQQMNEISLSMQILLLSVYFGVLGRECSVLCTEKMASVIGYWNREGPPSRQLMENICAICDQELTLAPEALEKYKESPNGSEEKTFRVNCGHIYHEYCLRGWIMLGKKDTCAFCKEKVTTSDVLKHPWQRQAAVWASMLDFLRYVFVWNPVILGIGALGLEYFDPPQ